MKYLLLLFIIFNIPVQASEESRRRELIQIIDEELTEVKRLNKQIGNSRPNELLRQAELYLEKARLIKDIENDKFLSMDVKQRRKISKAEFYKTSRSYFGAAQKTCNYILKKFRKFKGVNEVYYVLGFNAKEFGQIKKAESSFVKSIKTSPKNSEISNKAKLALAEIYYNKGQFKKARVLYENGLRNYSNKWWTKDSFNLAWSYFKTGKKSKAISTMKKVYAKSQDPNFINMGSAVERDLAYFYTESGQVKKAIKFYKDNGKDMAINLIKVGRNLFNQGKYGSAENVLTKASKHQMDQRLEIELHVMLINLYERSGKYNSHLKSVKKLYEFHKNKQLDSDNVEKLKYHVHKMSSMLQKQVTSGTYKSQKKILNSKANLALEYYIILADLNPKHRAKSYFYAAESLYSAKKFDRALDIYTKAFDEAKRNQDKKILKLSLEGQMACLAEKKLSSKAKDQHIETVFKNFITMNSKSKKSFLLYQRLFNYYFDKKDIINSEKVLTSFKLRYPKSISKHEAMIGKIMDYHKANKNRKAIEEWDAKIRRGEFRVGRKYAKKIRLLVLSMQFAGVEKASSAGDKKRALRGYVSIYKSRDTSKEAKRNAAYNIAILFHELRDPNRTYNWTKRALEIMTVKEIKSFEGSILTITADLFARRKFNEAADLYELGLDKMCKHRSKNKKIFFKNTNVIYLAQANLTKSMRLINNGYTCGISEKYIVEAEVDYLRALAESGKWSEYKDRVERVEKMDSAKKEIIPPMYKLYRELLSRGRDDEAKKYRVKILAIYNSAVKKRIQLPLESLDIIASFKIDILRDDFKNFSRIKLSFPEKKFNQDLGRKFKMLDNLTSNAVKIFSIGSGKGIVKSYRFLIESYKYLVSEVKNFVPDNKTREYVLSFKKSMLGVIAPLEKKITEFESEALKQIREHNILSFDNFWYQAHLNTPFRVISPVKRPGILMDRGGQQ